MSVTRLLTETPWEVVQTDPVLAALILQAVEVLERIDTHMGVVDPAPEQSIVIKLELRRIANEHSGKRH